MSHTKEPWNEGFANQIRAMDTGVFYPVKHICSEGDGRIIAFVVNGSDARRIVACVNALQGASTEELEKAVEMGITNVSLGNLFSSRLRFQKQHIDLLAALERLTFAAECRDNTMGDPCRLITVKAELAAAAEQSRSLIASVKGGAA